MSPSLPNLSQHVRQSSSLWDTVQDREPDCGEGKDKLLTTDWILKLIQVASKMLRNYRRKDLQRMEKGRKMGDDDVFSLMEPLVTFISDPKNRSPDIVKMVPQLMTLWFKIQRSGMFSDGDDVATAANGDAGRRRQPPAMPGEAQRVNAPSLPHVDVEMLTQLLAMLPSAKWWNGPFVCANSSLLFPQTKQSMPFFVHALFS